MAFECDVNFNRYSYDTVAKKQSGFISPAFKRKKIDEHVDKIKEKVEEEKKNPRNKVAVMAGSGVIGLSLLVAIFNPRISTKLIEKLKISQIKAKLRSKTEKDKPFKNKFYEIKDKTIDWITRFISYTNNVNSVKDTYFKQLCTEEKAFLGVRNNRKRRILKKGDNVFRKIFKKPHETLSRWGDNLGKHTVKRNYKIADKKMNKLENLLKEYSGRLSVEDKKEFDKIMQEISKDRKFFDEKNLNSRFEAQEEVMEHLNEDIRIQWVNYKHGFTNKYVKNSEHFNKNLSFWAQDITAPKREKLSRTGKEAVDKLLGQQDGKQGSFNRLYDLISAHLNPKEKEALKKTVQKTEKSLRTANKSECIDYFDKKRDLVLGSAPTDIVTAIVGLTIGGISYASADDRDKKISRLITGIIPTIAGFGTNIAFTSMLFSGSKGLLIGGATTFILSRIGSAIDHARLKAKGLLPVKEKKDDTRNAKAN